MNPRQYGPQILPPASESTRILKEQLTEPLVRGPDEKGPDAEREGVAQEEPGTRKTS